MFHRRSSIKHGVCVCLTVQQVTWSNHLELWVHSHWGRSGRPTARKDITAETGTHHNLSKSGCNKNLDIEHWTTGETTREYVTRMTRRQGGVCGTTEESKHEVDGFITGFIDGLFCGKSFSCPSV